MTLRSCATPGCPALTARGGRCGEDCCAGRCRGRKVDRPSPRSLGYDARWEKTRAAYLAEHPTCEWEQGCEEQGCEAEARHVDHKDGQGPLSPAGHDWSNLQALCHSHHSTKTALYDGGFGNRPKRRVG